MQFRFMDFFTPLEIETLQGQPKQNEYSVLCFSNEIVGFFPMQKSLGLVGLPSIHFLILTFL